MLRNSTIILLFSLMLIACGGGSTSGVTGDSRTATVGVVITDTASDDFDEAIATITSVELLCENGSQNLFTGSAEFDLLQLKDFVEMLTVTDGIQPDTCNKIRLILESLKLNVLNADDTVDETRSVEATLVANGKIDLKPHTAFTIHPGETLFVSLDFDVNRSLQLTETGNGKLIVRPVIFVKIGDSPGFKEGLTRVFGIIDEINADTSTLRICMDELTAQPKSKNTSDELPERCLLVGIDDDDLGSDTGVFGENGLPIQANELIVGDSVTVVGLLEIAVGDDILEPTPLAVKVKGDGDSDSNRDSDSDSRDDSDSDGSGNLPPALPFILEAIVVERGLPGTFLRLAGILMSEIDPATDTYKIAVAPNQGITIEPDNLLTGQLFAQSRIIDPDGTDIDRTILMTEDNTVIDGVLLLKSGVDEADALQTALMIIRRGASIDPPDSEDILIGTIQSIDAQTLMITPIGASTGDRCVNAAEAEVLFLVDSNGEPLDVIKGTVADLIENTKVTIFGTENSGGCFDADLIISRTAPK
jgi:hypothetical protein